MTDYSFIMKEELRKTVAAYKALVKQSDSLAAAMGYKPGYVLGKIMPLSIAARTDTKRITAWFNEEHDRACAHQKQNERIRTEQRERRQLIESLKLTPEQLALLDLDDG